jgi:hypothetical protein
LVKIWIGVANQCGSSIRSRVLGFRSACWCVLMSCSPGAHQFACLVLTSRPRSIERGELSCAVGGATPGDGQLSRAAHDTRADVAQAARAMDSPSHSNWLCAEQCSVHGRLRTRHCPVHGQFACSDICGALQSFWIHKLFSGERRSSLGFQSLCHTQCSSRRCCGHNRWWL